MKRFALPFVTISIILVVSIFGCSETPQTQPPPVDITETPTFELTEIPLPAGYGAHGSWIDIYFTDPESPLASQETGGPDGPLAESIDAARLSVDVAVYSLSLSSIRDALIHAHERGVQVRVVMESDNMDRSAPQALVDAGIPVLGNGDIIHPSDALEMKKRTGCNGVMIGRAATRNPWIFKQILQMDKGEPVREPDLSERRALIMEHYGYLSQYMGEHRAVFYMRGLLIRYTKGLAGSCLFREKITKIRDRASLVSTMDDYFHQMGAIEKGRRA